MILRVLNCSPFVRAAALGLSFGTAVVVAVLLVGPERGSTRAYDDGADNGAAASADTGTATSDDSEEFPNFGVTLSPADPTTENPTVSAEDARKVAGEVGVLHEQVQGSSERVRLMKYTQSLGGFMNPESSAGSTTVLAWDVAFLASAPDVHAPYGLSEKQLQELTSSLDACTTHVLVSANKAEVLQAFQACPAKQ
jgi:hypothetical protein